MSTQPTPEQQIESDQPSLPEQPKQPAQSDHLIQCAQPNQPEQPKQPTQFVQTIQPKQLQPPTAPEPFKFKLITPYSESLETTKVPFLVEGIFKQASLNALVGKPKQGKSSMSRCIAACVSKGQPFLGHGTLKGEVLLIAVEDSVDQINTCLRVLEYSEAGDSLDAKIYIVNRVTRDATENIAALRQALIDHPGVRLVVIDTLAKFVWVKKIEDYNNWLPVFDQLRQLVADFRFVTILCLIHAKKVTGEDPFDAMLGSSALRGEFDTNAAIVRDGNSRLFTTETRNGKAIEPTVLTAELIEIDGSEVVRKFALGESLANAEAQKEKNTEKKHKWVVSDRIVAYLSGCKNDTASYGDVVDGVQGKDETVIEGIEQLLAEGVITSTGTKKSSTDPYTLRLDRQALKMYEFTRRFAT